jgi:hypothetical protein
MGSPNGDFVPLLAPYDLGKKGFKMQINLSDPNPPTKFFFDDDFPEKGFALLRVLPTDEAQRIRKLCSKKRPPEYRRGQRYELDPKMNDELMSEKIWDYSIVSWEGLTDQNDEEIVCTTAMKVQLMKSVPEFTKFFIKCIEMLELGNQEPKEDRLKNLPSTSPD